MNMMKKILKSFLGYLFCLMFKVKHYRGVYIGFGAKLVCVGVKYRYKTT